ncbi:MAG: HAMP domain-containing histidine kinase [Nitrospinae bacterium]|nr:HAMP domain-containing histidine kinase [Nitrospinota bacterium]
MSRPASPLRFFVIIICLVILAEMVVMVALGYAYHHGELEFRAEAWLDALILGVIIAPALYLYQYRPSQEAIRELADTNRELAFSSTLYQSTFQMAGAGIAHADLEGRFLRVNTQFCAITGYAERELLLMRFQDITHPDDLEADLSAVEMLRSGKVADFALEKRYLRKGGEVVWVSLNVTLMRDLSANPWFFVAVVEEITERKEREFTMLRAQLEAEQANRTKDEFLALVAHDLKSPLFAMTELLKIVHGEQRKVLSVKNNELMGHAIKTGEQMVVAIKKLLDLSRIQRGVLDLRMEQAPLREIVGYALGKAAFEGETKRVRLVNEVPEEVMLRIDTDLLLEIVYNLVSNGVKFSHRGATVRVAYDAAGRCLTVEDEGVGISPDQIADLFEVKKKVVGKGTAGEKGFGIGLPFCKKGMEMMGGDIRVESAEGKGSRFLVTFPVSATGETN